MNGQASCSVHTLLGIFRPVDCIWMMEKWLDPSLSLLYAL